MAQCLHRFESYLPHKMFIFGKKTTQELKKRARRTLSSKLLKRKRSYVIDTSAIINKFLPRLIFKGLKGKIIIPNAVMAELENLANKGKEEGFIGLEEVTKLHTIKKKSKIQVYFYGLRPTEQQIKFAKSGEIDALIREIALKTKSTLVTSDLVQAKSAQAYNISVLYLKPKKPKKKLFLFWKY
ncbi:MAG: PIN domain-containing protein [Candidatus Nanoarchaeia archaeon]